MSKGLRNIPSYQVQEVIRRRINSGTKGLGYWAAIDATRTKEEKNKQALMNVWHAIRTQALRNMPECLR